MSIIQVKPVIDYPVRFLCFNPYPGHKNGCPNYGKRSNCPPQAPFFDKIIDMEQTIFAIYNEFPLGEHVARMREKHPAWSERQLACCLYWQGTARKQLRSMIEAFQEINPGYTVIDCPEACGVNLTATMALVNVHLEWPPVEIARQIVLVGRGKKCVNPGR